jgi:hypothetical protein
VRGDENWRLLAQSINAMADHLGNTIGFAHTPVVFSELPPAPRKGMLCCISDAATAATIGSAITVGGGTKTVLTFYNGTNWTVCGV